MTRIRANRAGPLPQRVWLADSLTGVAVVGRFATGALHSVMAEGGMAALGPGARTAIRLVHKSCPYLAAGAAAVVLVWLGKR